MKPYRPSRFRLSWWHLFFALLLIGFGWCHSRCRDVDAPPLAPCDASRLSGRWQGAESPYWLYDFNYPHLTQHIEIGGTTAVQQEYIYATHADTLWASGPGGERLWSVCFLDDSTVEYRKWDIIKWSPAHLLFRR